MATDWVAPTIAAGAALVGIFLGSRGEQRRWLRDQRRDAYAAFMEAVYGVRRAQNDGEKAAATALMGAAVIAVTLVGPQLVVSRADAISPILRASPIDVGALTHAVNAFMKAASFAVSRGSWYSLRVLFQKKEDDAVVRARVAQYYPPPPPP